MKEFDWDKFEHDNVVVICKNPYETFNFIDECYDRNITCNELSKECVKQQISDNVEYYCYCCHEINKLCIVDSYHMVISLDILKLNWSDYMTDTIEESLDVNTKEKYKYELKDLVNNPMKEYVNYQKNIRYRYNNFTDKFEYYDDIIEDWRNARNPISILFSFSFKEHIKEYNIVEAIQMIYNGKTMKSCIDYIYKLDNNNNITGRIDNDCDWTNQGFSEEELNGKWVEYNE